ncbi:6448_t:CDS:2 [Racocetra persica]|uniref:6448_t:CDS:1 n=1 Tax=Racocetra persica TaxID=160502 RepID=A0ACA9R9J5_9GLOM|nr:6448_t:CDS:2 [Racocetra persica]
MVKRHLSITLESNIYQQVKENIPTGQISPLVNNLLKEYLKKKKKEQLAADYQSTARIDCNYKPKKGKERELEIASKIKKIRPSLVVSNDEQNKYDEEIIVAPLTSKELEKIRSYELLIKRNKKNGLDEDSKILLNRLLTIEKATRLGEYIGVVEPEMMKEVKERLKLVLDLED